RGAPGCCGPSPVTDRRPPPENPSSASTPRSSGDPGLRWTRSRGRAVRDSGDGAADPVLGGVPETVVEDVAQGLDGVPDLGEADVERGQPEAQDRRFAVVADGAACNVRAHHLVARRVGDGDLGAAVFVLTRGDALDRVVGQSGLDEVVTPREHEHRGSQVSIAHPQGNEVMSALIARGIIGDYREPSVLRFGLTPLYIGFTEVCDTVEALRDILDYRLWDAPEHMDRG